MTRSSRLTGLGLLAVLLALASGCAATISAAPAIAGRPATAVTRNFSAMGLAFEYPAAWRSGVWGDDVSNFSGLIVYLSTSTLRNPCTVSRQPGRIAKVCQFPVRALPPGGVLAEWSADGWPRWHLPRANMVIAGHQALETTTTSGGWCATLRGTTTITVMIPRTAAGN